MDVNGTRFHLLLGQRDWSAALAATPGNTDVVWDAEHGRIALAPLLFLFPSAPASETPRRADRSGTARDRYGNWFWIVPDAAAADGGGVEIRARFADGTGAEHYWSSSDAVDAPPASGDDSFTTAPSEVPPPARPMRLRGLAITDDHYLVVGTLEPAGLLVFDLHAGGTPVRIDWPVAVAFRPFDMSPAPGGGLFILDRTLDPLDADTTARLWSIDRYFRLVSLGPVALPMPVVPDFLPLDPTTATAPVDPIPADPAMALALMLDNPIAIEALPDDSVLILTTPASGASAIHRYRSSIGVTPFASLEGVLDRWLDVPGPVIRGYDMAFVADDPAGAGLSGVLTIAASDGNQAFAFRCDVPAGTLTLVTEYFPMRRFGGKGLVAAGGVVYYDLGDIRLPLVPQPRPRFVSDGTVLTPVFDGRLPGCVWHRLLLDAVVPAGASIGIQSRTSDEPDLVDAMPWNDEPTPILRADGAEIAYYRPFAGAGMSATRDGATCDGATCDGAGTWEILFQHAVGRFTQLRLTLVGTGQASPGIQALRAWFPRFSYLTEYLPPLYRDDESSASFLDRYLANIEGMFTTIEGRIEQAQMLLDVRTAAPEYLDWLGGWLGVMLDAEWSPAKRRLFLKHAVAFFDRRGTPTGLLQAIRFAIDPAPDASVFSADACGCRDGLCRCSSGSAAGCFEVRLVEQFMRRSLAGAAVVDHTDTEGPRLMAESTHWDPAAGGAALDARYRAYLRSRYAGIGELNARWGRCYNVFEDIRFSPVTPSSPAAAEDWRAFITATIGFDYVDVLPADAAAYRLYLARRYGEPSRLNAAYRWSGSAAVARFQDLALPSESDMPTGGARLGDWLQFVSLVLPIARGAHRFTVLVPVDAAADDEAQQRLMGLVGRVVELEKPAHTTFDLEAYWALFRVGAARVAYDTALSNGSRFTALVLGKHRLAAGVLGSRYPWDVRDRRIVGRDPVMPEPICDRSDL